MDLADTSERREIWTWGMWDMLDIFRLDRFESHLWTISQIEGSNAYQTAFRLEQSFNLTMRADEAFSPCGTLLEFSFECTYRERQKQQDLWHLFHFTDFHEESQLSVTLNPSRETLQVRSLRGFTTCWASSFGCENFLCFILFQWFYFPFST